MSDISFIAPDIRRLEGAKVPAIALYLFAEKKPLQSIAALIDWRLCGHLSRIVIEGFFNGQGDEVVLLPLGGHLPHEFLLLLGLGDRDKFDKQQFQRGLRLLFDKLQRLKANGVAVALPGRPEGICETTDAIEWFLALYENEKETQTVTLIEPVGAQKLMTGALDRWRLKQTVP